MNEFNMPRDLTLYNMLVRWNFSDIDVRKLLARNEFGKNKLPSEIKLAEGGGVYYENIN